MNSGPYASRNGPAVDGCALSPVCRNRNRITLTRIRPVTGPTLTRTAVTVPDAGGTSDAAPAPIPMNDHMHDPPIPIGIGVGVPDAHDARGSALAASGARSGPNGTTAACAAPANRATSETAIKDERSMRRILATEASNERPTTSWPAVSPTMAAAGRLV